MTACQSLVQSVEQEAPIGQARKRVIEGEVFDFIFSRFAVSDVDLSSDIIGYFTFIAFYRSDSQPLGMTFSILAAIPDFSLPGPGALDTVPHGRIKSGVVTTRVE